MSHKSENCSTCPAYNPNGLKKLGIKIDSYDYVIALAGNPNTGKSTVFNALTGLHQHTGNWPGKTVARAEGGFVYADNKYKIIDLPGTYSLLSTSVDEEVARDFILFGQPNVTIIVADATRLERNLNLVLQVLEITDRAVLCLNLFDEAKRHNIEVDTRSLSRELGIPVVGTTARKGEGIPELLKMLNEVATGKFICKPRRNSMESSKVKKSIDTLSSEIAKQYPGLDNTRWIALRLLEGDQRMIDAVKSGELSNLTNRKSDTIIESADE